MTQSNFAAECNLNKLAALVGLSPLEFRLKNAVRPGQLLPSGQVADPSTALVETLEAVRPYFEENPQMGIACAFKNAGLGMGVPDTGRCQLTVSEEGIVLVESGAACLGQGVGTVLVQVVCQATGLSPQQVVWVSPDTDKTPNSGMTTASRQTVFAGEAAHRAALGLANALETHTLAQLAGRKFLGEYTAATTRLGSEDPQPSHHVAYSYATHLVELEENGTLKRVIAAHDVGTAMNPLSIEGQVEGGVVMSLGYALTEDFPLEEGAATAKFGTLGLFRGDRVPPIATLLVEGTPGTLAAGAKGIGEISSIPTPAAVQHAYWNHDGVFRTMLPLPGTPYAKK